MFRVSHLHIEHNNPKAEYHNDIRSHCVNEYETFVWLLKCKKIPKDEAHKHLLLSHIQMFPVKGASLSKMAYTGRDKGPDPQGEGFIFVTNLGRIDGCLIVSCGEDSPPRYTSPSQTCQTKPGRSDSSDLSRSICADSRALCGETYCRAYGSPSSHPVGQRSAVRHNGQRALVVFPPWRAPVLDSPRCRVLQYCTCSSREEENSSVCLQEHCGQSHHRSSS